ncbi:hypothetical protein COLO4_17260 [Corchorus olitorius]|uniref:Uncharacterized protein n=1 Tax=Corchorus olitorius TaxID=93759 RepID=A0A1R3JDF0_9ROSI|nr:hypothetical protein COLO4_17260 [Corchorus olitorius]
MATTTKSVDPSLWWEPFSSLLTELENASPTDDLPKPLAKKLKENHDWFVETVHRFKPPNEKSKEALSSQKIKIGPHELTVKPDFRDKALQSLDEVQAYILVDRYLECGNNAENYIVHDPIHVGPVAGYRSVLRTFISAFIASYEINLQEVGLQNACKCGYNFLDKSTGISSLFDITTESVFDRISQIVETQHPVRIPGVDGFHIPSKTRGHILRFVGGNTALVRWEHTKSAVFVLLLRLAQTPYLEKNEEAFLTLDLLGRLVSFNTGC